jgi:hypothetical protein
MTTNNPYQLSINLSQLSDIDIIIVTKYLTEWEEATPVKDCNAETTMHVLFEQVIRRFVCPRIFMSYQGIHFINSTI